MAQLGKRQVLLVDDHAGVRQELRNLLERYPDVEVVGEAAGMVYRLLRPSNDYSPT